MDFTPNQRLIDLHVGLHSIMSITWDVFYMQMVYSTYTKLRIVNYHSRGIKPYTIARLLREDDGIVRKFGVANFLKVYQSTRSIERCPRSGRLSSWTWRIKEVVEQQMQEDDETTATQLHQMLFQQGHSDITPHCTQV